MYYIYKIENKLNGKKYIGLTNNIKRRRARHFTDLRCQRHDNSFLQKEFNRDGEFNFSFEILFEEEIDYKKISEKEREYIQQYDSYWNGYNQNEGGNFGPSNGGSHLTKSDLFSILSALDFISRPGQILSDMFEVSKTTISRIKKGENHACIKEEYEKLPLAEKKEIYRIFCESTNFYETKVNTTIIKSKRKLTEEQVHLTFLNEEIGRKKSLGFLTRKFGINNCYSLTTILQGRSYKDYALTYLQLTQDQKDKLVSLLGD